MSVGLGRSANIQYCAVKATVSSTPATCARYEPEAATGHTAQQRLLACIGTRSGLEWKENYYHDTAGETPETHQYRSCGQIMLPNCFALHVAPYLSAAAGIRLYW